MNNEAVVSCNGISEPEWLQKMLDFAVKAMNELKLESWELSLVLCDEDFIHNLNKEYREMDCPTDVLSFELGEWQEIEGSRRYIAGDVIICLEIMKKNASQFEVSEEEELKRLIIHGILHLSGMDHKTNDESEVMLAKQEELLAKMAEERIF